MLTLDFDRLGVRPGDRLLDAGCGSGRHACEALRRGARVVALDATAAEAAGAAAWLDGMVAAGQAGSGGAAAATAGDAGRLPFPDAAFDRAVAAEVLEHVADDAAVMGELSRVLRPGGTLAVTVPRWFPERVNWALSREYHEVEGGHVRIYRRGPLRRHLAAAGLRPTGSHHAHALHTPYWWLRCAVGVGRDQQLVVRAYHRALVWDLTHPRSPLRLLERALDPLLGKSLVLYLQKPPC